MTTQILIGGRRPEDVQRELDAKRETQQKVQEDIKREGTPPRNAKKTLEDSLKTDDTKSHTVLLDKTPIGVLRATHFYRPGVTGVVDSIQAVQSAGLLQVPTYAHAHGRSFEDLESLSRSQSYNSLGERLTSRVDKDYQGIPKGDYVVDIQGGGLFMPRHEIIRRAIQNSKLVNNAIPINSQDKDLLLGERQVYKFDGKKVQVVPITHFFTSYEQFADVSQTKEFEKALRDLSAVYVVLRSVEEARKNPSGKRPLVEQLSNPDLVIVCGSKARLNKMLMKSPDSEGRQVPRFNWENFGSWHDGYENVDTGHVGVLGDDDCYYNVIYGSVLDGDGGSGGVAPEALNAWKALNILKVTR